MKGNRALLALVVALLMGGCATSPPPSTEPAAAPTAVPTTRAPDPTAVPPSPTSEAALQQPTPTESAGVAEHAGLPLPAEQGKLFSASGACATCHAHLVDESGADVSIDAFWRSTMMANAARDPYWQASVREEVLDHPDFQAVIEDTCAKCHTPMARFTAAVSGGAGQVLDTGFLDTEHEYHTLAIDGVSCTLCHQVEEADFGEAVSFSGGFAIDAELPAGERVTYGPFPVGRGQAAIMQAASGFVPVESPHVRRAELCATCHTLYTPYVDAAGQVAGQFPEQTPYLEWQHSDYQDAQACQDCHMPVAQGAVQLSITGGPPRSPFSQHIFVGGNAYVLSILRAFGEELDVTASSGHFGDKVAQVVDQLESRTASLVLEDAEVSGPRLAVTVAVQGWAGHKFPTGYPSRRAWLHFVVQDSGGRVLFESGAVGPDGSIAGNDNDADPAAYEPHYQVIFNPDQVQIYEPILQDAEGSVTTALLRASDYVKDNRLLPSGFDKRTAPEDVAVRGEAVEDEDFLGGGDRVRYEVPLDGAVGPFVVTVDLLYQSIGYRWVQNLGRRHEAPEIARFLGYYGAMPNLPVIVAAVTAEVE
jgi:hypothetical protein